MVTEVIRAVNYFPGIFQRANQIRDKVSEAPVDVYNLVAIEKVILAVELQNLSSGFPTKQDSNQSPQLQRQARKLRFCL